MTESIHLTSTHRPFDTRVFQKECRTLAAAGYDVTLIVPHSKDEIRDGVKIRAVPLPKDGRERLKKTTRDVYKAALKENPEAIFHFHDSELIPFMLMLKLRGRRVIYDAHEDTPLQMMYQTWIPALMRKPAALFMNTLETIGSMIFDRIIAAEPVIARHFSTRKTIVLHNYPMLGEFEQWASKPYAERPPHIGFAGGISEVRGVFEAVEAMRLLPDELGAEFQLAGTFYPSSLKEQVERSKGWKRVRFRGWLDRQTVLDMLAGVRIGLITRHAIPRHLEAFPTKLFEYMASGLPVVVSDLPRIRPFVEESECGVLIDPRNPEQIAAALVELLSDLKKAEAMGRRGRRAIEEKYNWERESKKLLQLYAGLAGQHSTEMN